MNKSDKELLGEKLISKIKSIWNEFILSLNWPYVSNKDHGIFRKKLYQFLEANNKFNDEKIYFMDNDGMEHEIGFKYGVFYGDYYISRDYSFNVKHCNDDVNIFMVHRISKDGFLTPATIDAYKLIKKSNTIDFENVYSEYLFGYNDEPEILKYRLFYYNSVVNFNELNRQMDILIMKCL